MQIKTLTVALALTFSAHAAQAQGLGAPGLPPEMASMMTLGSGDVKKLLATLPDLSSLRSSQSGAFMGSMGGGRAEPPSEQDMKELQAVLGKHGYDVMTFSMKMSALVATYVTLKPGAFDEIMPSEKSPHIQKILKDPSIPQAEKEKVRANIEAMQKNKPVMLQQFEALATAENKKAVRPHLGEIDALFDEMQKEAQERAQKARQK